MEESLSPQGLSLSCGSPGPLARKLQQYQQSMEEERMMFAEQFNDFREVDMTRSLSPPLSFAPSPPPTSFT